MDWLFCEDTPEDREEEYRRREKLKDEYYRLSSKERAEYKGVDDYVTQEMNSDDGVWTLVGILALLLILFH